MRIPVLFIDDLDTVLQQANPLHIPPDSPLANNITAIAHAVEIVTGGNPLAGRPLPGLAGSFATQFLGDTPARTTLSKILHDHGLDPRAEVDWLEKVRLRLEADDGAPGDVAGREKHARTLVALRRELRLVQTGNLQTYAFLFVLGVAAVLYLVLGK